MPDMMSLAVISRPGLTLIRKIKSIIVDYPFHNTFTIKNYHFSRLLQLLEVVEKKARVASLCDGHVEGVVQHEDVVAVEVVGAEEPVAVIEDRLYDAALKDRTIIQICYFDYGQNAGESSMRKRFLVNAATR